MLQLIPAGAGGLGRAEIRRACDAHSSVRAVVDRESADAAQRAQHAGHHRRARACGHCTGRNHSLHTYGALAGEPLLQAATRTTSFLHFISDQKSRCIVSLKLGTCVRRAAALLALNVPPFLFVPWGVHF